MQILDKMQPSLADQEALQLSLGKKQSSLADRSIVAYLPFILKSKFSSSLTYLSSQNLGLAKQQTEEFLRKEVNEKWLEYDRLTMELWKKKQEKLAKIQEVQEKEKLRIRAEYEANRERLRKLKEEKIRLAEEKLEQHKRLADAIEKYINEDGPVPDELTENANSNPGKEMCPFFTKVGFPTWPNH